MSIIVAVGLHRVVEQGEGEHGKSYRVRVNYFFSMRKYISHAETCSKRFARFHGSLKVQSYKYQSRRPDVAKGPRGTYQFFASITLDVQYHHL
jgi:hypothetical protein